MSITHVTSQWNDHRDAMAGMSRPRLIVLLVLTGLPVVLTTLVSPLVVRAGIHRVLPYPTWPFAVYSAFSALTVALVVAIGGMSSLRRAGLRLHWSIGRVGMALVGFAVGNLIFVVVDWLLTTLSLPSVAGMTYPAPRGGAWIAFALSTVVVPPVSEEIFFRVLWIGALGPRIGAVKAIPVSIFVFACIHYPYFGLGGTLFISVWSLVPVWLFERYGDLTAPLVMHIVNNIAAYLVYPRFPTVFSR